MGIHYPKSIQNLYQCGSCTTALPTAPPQPHLRRSPNRLLRAGTQPSGLYCSVHSRPTPMTFPRPILRSVLQCAPSAHADDLPTADPSVCATVCTLGPRRRPSHGRSSGPYYRVHSRPTPTAFPRPIFQSTHRCYSRVLAFPHRCYFES